MNTFVVEATRAHETSDAAPARTGDFSLFLGGPFYQLWRRTRMTGEAMDLLGRRIMAITLLTWAPLLVLSIVEGYAWGGSVKLPFLLDVEVNVRFLLALPLLVVAEMVVHHRMCPVVRQFVERGLITESTRAKFDAAVASAQRLRNSYVIEILLALFVYVVGVGFIWRQHVVFATASWSAVPVNGGWQPTMAGWWMGFVSLPLFQFLLLRWYFRLFIWGRFLWHVSRIDLKLVPTHPDRCGGLGFLSSVIKAFAPVLVAQGALLAGMMADRIFYMGASLPQFKVELIGLVAFMVFAILGPLLVFAPKLAAVKRTGLREYGGLAQRYVREFDEKWLRGGAPPEEPFVGSADIQSLADLGNSFEVVKDMGTAPFNLRTALQLGVITLLPVAPLLLTMLPLEELLDRLLKVVF